MQQVLRNPNGADAVQDSADRRVAPAQSVVERLFGPVEQRPFAIRWWTGAEDRPDGGDCPTVVIKRPGALRQMLLPPREVALAEAYLRGDVEIEGDLGSLTDAVDTLAKRLRSPANLLRLLPAVLALPTDREADARGGLRSATLEADVHSQQRDAEAIKFHYDVGNDFYQLWLDRNMVYSCAYFSTGAESLDEAQEAKLDYICRKLRLQPGERLLDIGCGWGALVRYAAREYGVTALGVTLSPAQASYARQRIAADGLEDRCRVEVRDYRALQQAGPFDKIASVGMVEHVGLRQLPTYFEQAFRLLEPGGLFFNQGIVFPTRDLPVSVGERFMGRLWGDGSFVQRYVFPDGELTTPGDLIARAEAAGFETRDVESLREHYALTLAHWVRRLEAHHAEAVALVGETTYRIWRLYMSSFAHIFKVGSMGLAQAVFSKRGNHGGSRLPLTRADLYANGEVGVPIGTAETAA